MRRHRSVASILGALALTVAPAAPAAPCAGFTDVQDSSSFCIHIEWLKNRAITLGCATNQYCPTDYVRRDQMAAFLYRLGVQNAFLQGGNAFGFTALLGTTENRSLQLIVNGGRALTLAPSSNALIGSIPNVIGGHPANKAEVTCTGICLPTPEPVVGAVVAGGGHLGEPNRVTESFGVVSGGRGNRAGNDNANEADARYATVSGGIANTASDLAATVGGGGGNTASGFFSTVAGGASNAAAGDYSFAAGRRAKALGTGSFVFADSSDVDFSSPDANRFLVRATGGVSFITGISGAGSPTWACTTSSGNGWACLSDRSMKHSLVELDDQAVLAKVAALPVYQWQPLGDNAHVKHYGPMAQDFHAAFGLGDNEKMIGMQDADGVALAAIKGLNAKLEQRIAIQAKEIAELRRLVDALASRMPAY